MIKLKPQFWTFKTNDAHSPYGPSSYSRWKACPASIKLSEGIVLPEKEYSVRGTLCHEISEALARREFIQFPYLTPSQVGQKLAMRELSHQDSMDILEKSQGAIEAVKYFINVVGDPSPLILFEKKIPMAGGEMFGSADVLIIGQNSCVILDYKFGKGKVSASSLQLKAYLMGVAENMVEIPEHYQFIAGIYQPEVSIGYDEYVYNKYEMLDGLVELVQDIQNTKNARIPEEGSHCFWCPASRTEDESKKCPLIKAKQTVNLFSEAIKNMR